MSKQHRLWMTLWAALLVASVLLTACGSAATPTSAPAQPTSAPAEPTQPPASGPTTAPAEPTVAPTTAPAEATQAPAAGTPKVGGTLRIGITQEPPTMDQQKANGDIVLYYLGAGLIGKDKDNNYVPWLAESWTTSTDGKVLTFKLRKDVKFTDGTPLKASDWVYTFTRAMDPATQSPVTGQMLTTVAKVEAPDDYTFVVTLKEPTAPFMDNLAAAGFIAPLSKAAVDKAGDKYGRNPVGVGPYKMKEWVTGDHITLERNPDYTWQPAYAQHQGPYYIQEITFRIIPETATLVAGLEAGEIDYVYGIDPQYLQGIKDTGKFNILETYLQGAYPYVPINVSKWPFDDLKVRQAFNYAVDRQDIIDVVQKGNAVIQYGPISSSTVGYWSGVEQVGYGFDLEKAKSLMADAGWKAGSDGILAKDGKALKLSLITFADFLKEAQIIKEQLTALGADITIQQVDLTTTVGKLNSGDFDMGIIGYQWPNYDILWLVYHSKQIGVLNLSQVKDPDLDKLLDAMRTETDPAKQQQAVDDAQKRIVEQAYAIQLYTPKSFFPLANNVQGAYLSQKNNNLYLEDAWIQ